MKQKSPAMKKMNIVTTFCCAVLVASAVQADPFDRKKSSGRQVLLRSAAIDTVAARQGLTVLDTSVLPDGNLYLVESASGENGATLLHRLKIDPAVSDAETAFVASLPAEVAASSLLLQASEDLSRVGTAATPCQRTYLGETWAGCQAAVLETTGPNAAHDWHDWAAALPGVVGVEVVFVHWDGAGQEVTHAGT